MIALQNDLARAFSLGTEMAVAVFLGAGIGYWLDGQLKTAPWLMIIGLFIGAVTGFWIIYKFVAKNERS